MGSLALEILSIISLSSPEPVVGYAGGYVAEIAIIVVLCVVG